MNTGELVDKLAAHRMIGPAPRAELEWLAAHGEVRHFVAGEALARKGEIPTELIVVLEGRGGMYVDRGGGVRKVTEWQAGDVTGLLPFSRMGPAPGNPLFEQASVALMLNRRDFPEMIRECPAVTAQLVHAMIDRVRHFASTDWQDDKMMSLGRLAAGLSHELNNPASAAARSAKRLGEAIMEGDAIASELAAAHLTDDQRARVDALRARATGALDATNAVSPIDRADREDEICNWLAERNVDQAIAGVLAESGITRAMLDDLASTIPREALDVALRWIAAGHSARALAMDVERATTRIHELVSAVKRFSYMDRPAVATPASIATALADTVAILAAKARAKSACVALDIPPDLPLVRVYGGELNQVWSNLLENALDSIGPEGHVKVTAQRERTNVVVRVIDDGPGIPAENLSRIFDPFFTTKPIGQGTGLGLDIAQRIVRRHDGHIDVESRPGGGRTEFRVSLPAL